MPTYEYQCGTCGNRFEKYQSFSDAPLKICPECGNEVRKVYSAAGVIFKGSGWYINDSRNKSGGSKSEAKAETSGAETKSEAKTEAKAETTGGESKSSDSKTEAA